MTGALEMLAMYKATKSICDSELRVFKKLQKLMFEAVCTGEEQSAPMVMQGPEGNESWEIVVRPKAKKGQT